MWLHQHVSILHVGIRKIRKLGLTLKGRVNSALPFVYYNCKSLINSAHLTQRFVGEVRM